MYVYIYIYIYINNKVSRLCERRLGSSADPGPRPSAQGWHAPCKTGYWVASPKISSLAYLCNLFNNCYPPFTAGSTEATELRDWPICCLSHTATRPVSLSVIVRIMTTELPLSQLRYQVH
jgi:hypothetical protein